MSDTVRAVLLPRHGASDVLEIAAVPAPRAAERTVVVEVAAASVNPVDVKQRQGYAHWAGMPSPPFVLGRDLAGTIVEGGDERWRDGTRVFAFISWDRGAQAERVAVRFEELAAVPDGIDAVTAAAVPLAALTAWQGLFDHGGLAAGETVLIHGGSGGVGHFAVQFAKAQGARVIATASAGAAAFVRDLGADVVVDYQHERFEDAGEADVVLDLVGGDTLARSWAVLREGGAMISTVADPDPAAAGKPVRAATRFMAKPDGAQLARVGAMIAAGAVRVAVDRTLPLAQAAAAQDALDREHPQGKIVLTL